MADDAANLLEQAYGPQSTSTADVLAQYAPPRATPLRPFHDPALDPRGAWPALPPMPDRRPEARNPSRPEQPRVQRDVAEALSPTMGAYGLGSAATLAGMQAREGKYAEAAESALPVAAMFAGVRAKTANLPMLERAQAMAAKGAPREAIWGETGWFEGPDKKWRFEIDDSAAKFGLGKGRGLDNDVVRHPDLAEAYPALSRQKMKIGDDLYEGSYSPITGSINVQSIKPDTRKEIALHELQHRVQGIEGFDKGSSPHMVLWTPEYRDRTYRGQSALSRDLAAENVYKLTRGEVEADNTMARSRMSPQERQSTPPWETEPVSPDRQIRAPGNLQSAASIWSSLPWYAKYPTVAQLLGWGAQAFWPEKPKQPPLP